MRILIDADGCPVVDIAVRAARQDRTFERALEEIFSKGDS
jgi:uncharacterized protein YaiI (UPF0178 family)